MGWKQPGGESGASWFGDDEPWIIGALDDDFVNAATIVERSADERISEMHQLAVLHAANELIARSQDTVWRAKVRHRRRRQRIVALVVLMALIVGAGARVWLWLAAPDPASPLQLGDVAGSRSWSTTQLPPPPATSSRTPLGRPGPVPSARGTYRFIATQTNGTTPVAYDPCRPIHYVVDASNAPPGADEILASAITDLRKATGLRFVDDGATDERPSSDRAAYQPDRYGERWAPVLIAWTDRSEVPELGGDVVGSAGSVQFRRSAPLAGAAGQSEQLYVTGTVNLDGTDLAAAMSDSDDGTAMVRAVVLHELGHLVGLDHVQDRGELMYPTANDVTDYGPGDLHGLAALGNGQCFPDV